MKVKLFVLATGIGVLCGCLNLNSVSHGPGTEVIGRVIIPTDSVAIHARVYLRKTDFCADTAGRDTQERRTVTTTDGSFSFENVPPGEYTVEALDTTHGQQRYAVVIRFEIPEKQQQLKLDVSTMKEVGSIVGTVVSGNASLWVQIYGLERVAKADPATGTFLFRDIPEGSYSLRMVSSGQTITPKELIAISVTAGTSTNIGNVDAAPLSAWSHSWKLYLNTTSSGAGITGTMCSFPVLIRLTSAEMQFNQARGDGADLRFAKADGTALPFEIERWDSAAQKAEVWVTVDTVYGNDNTHSITMYWGNASAGSTSNSAAVFDTGAAGGFQGVWHLAETQGALVHDATADQFSGLPSATAPASAPGAVGQGLFFNGINSYITITGTETGRLNFPARSSYSLSAWVFADTLDSTWQNIVGKGNTQYHMQIWRPNEWLFTEYEDHAGWESTRAPATSRTWVLVTGVRDGYDEYLYVNGSCVDSVPEIASFSDSTRYLGNPVTIGCATFKDPHLDYFFKGTIDEVRIHNRALSPDWVKLCHANQKPDGNSLVVFQKESTKEE